MAGIGRFFSAGFLGVWLTGWVVGEAFALGILGFGAWSLLTGQPPGAGREPLRPELALPVGLFLLFWLTLWTIGGIAAGREMLRLLFGRDRIRVGPENLEIERSYGLFRSRQKLKRDELRRFYCRRGHAALCIETARGTTELTRLGTIIEKAELEKALNAELQFAPGPSLDGALPEPWCEISSMEREPVLVKNPALRRKQAVVIWIICVPVLALALCVISAAMQRRELWGLALILVGLTLLIAWGASWLTLGRNEWRLEKGRLVLQRRFGQDRTPRFEAVALELSEDNSGEGDTSYLLSAVKRDATSLRVDSAFNKQRRTIYSQSGDATEPRKFGQWLSQRCQIPFSDLTTPAAKEQDLKALMQQLANSGRFGRAALSVVKRLAPSQTNRGLNQE